MHKQISFSSDINNITLPTQLDYPFNYVPHKIAQIAVNELQEYLKNQTDFTLNFGITNPKDIDALGKMFGVLVVKNNINEVGYLAAFSGKLCEKTQYPNFVPPVYDLLDEFGFYKKTENEINEINTQLDSLETDVIFLKLKKKYNKLLKNHQSLILEEQLKIKKRRKDRKLHQLVNNQLNINEEFYLREYEVYLNGKISTTKKQFENYQLKIEELKKFRKDKSAWVQQEIFKNYKFLNSKKEKKDLLSIFKNSTQNIPAGAGDCCAPKLFQHAFLNNLTPIALAEFWWGKPLSTSVRKHLNFYSACNGKCKPILTHMLEGLNVEVNPLIKQLQHAKEIETIFEDEHILVINKPNELLSVSGTEIKDSVYSRIKEKYPEATGPLLVHRLDMSTSGILLIAKTKNIHQNLQAQFINRTIKKRYVALLDGKLPLQKGEITLPLKVDFGDRPKQMVCYEFGKKAVTKWKHMSFIDNKTKVYFYPITGRTHQLRVHAAHTLGLNTPIVGDDLYGKKEKRLYLHAERITFKHPITFKTVTFTCDAPF